MTQHYPVSLLELNTFGHAISALLIYFCWWEKPLDISDGTFFEFSILVKRRALELMKVPSAASTSAIRSIRSRLESDRRFSGLEKVPLPFSQPKPHMSILGVSPEVEGLSHLGHH